MLEVFREYLVLQFLLLTTIFFFFSFSSFDIYGLIIVYT